MRLLDINRTLLCYFAAFCLLGPMASVRGQSNTAEETKSSSCPNEDAGLKLPNGFCATVFAEGIGHVVPVIGQLIPLLARHFASFATDTDRCVSEKSVRHSFKFGRLVSKRERECDVFPPGDAALSANHAVHHRAHLLLV